MSRKWVLILAGCLVVALSACVHEPPKKRRASWEVYADEMIKKAKEGKLGGYGSMTAGGSGYPLLSHGSSSSSIIGSTVYHSGGLTTQKIGDTFYHSDGTKTQKIGDTFYHSGGGRSTIIGDTIYHSGY